MSHEISYLLVCCLDLLIRNTLKIITSMHHEFIFYLFVDVEGDVGVIIRKQLVS